MNTLWFPNMPALFDFVRGLEQGESPEEAAEGEADGRLGCLGVICDESLTLRCRCTVLSSRVCA